MGRPALPLAKIGAVGMLLLAALLWGAGNVANKTLLVHVGPLTALAIRGLIALIVVLPLLRREGGGTPDGAWLRSALVVSLLFVAASVAQQVAYVWTSVTNVSFLVNTCTVMTALLAWLLLRQRPGWRTGVAGMATLAGAFLMSGMAVTNLAMNPGDLACLVSALCYAGSMVALGHHIVRHGRPLATAAVQFGLIAVLMLPISFGFEAPTAQGVVSAWRELLFLGIFSTAAACALTNAAQRHVPASLAAVLLSAESVFGAAGAFLLLGEQAHAAGLFGGALILAAIALAARDGAPGRRGAVPAEIAPFPGPTERKVSAISLRVG